MLAVMVPARKVGKLVDEGEGSTQWITRRFLALTEDLHKGRLLFRVYIAAIFIVLEGLRVQVLPRPLVYITLVAAFT